MRPIADLRLDLKIRLTADRFRVQFGAIESARLRPRARGHCCCDVAGAESLKLNASRLVWRNARR
jgi:hypothetical protein